MNDFLARAGAFALALLSFCVSNPELSVPLLGALAVLVLKPKTPEQYDRIAKFSGRLAAALQLLGAIFPDLAKAKKVAPKLFGKSVPPPPPDGPTSGEWPVSAKKPPSGLSIVALAATFSLLLSGCGFLQKHAKDALSVAQIGCIIANQFQPDSKVAELCQIADDYFEPMQKVLADARKKSDEVAAQAAESTRAGTCGKRREP